ncbi:MAG: hypothetical protein NZM26_01820 [Patescibacteria group bacterium]|nr:hypothetical protein [Patescibacteria group bacterium]
MSYRSPNPPEANLAAYEELRKNLITRLGLNGNEHNFMHPVFAGLLISGYPPNMTYLQNLERALESETNPHMLILKIRNSPPHYPPTNELFLKAYHLDKRRLPVPNQIGIANALRVKFVDIINSRLILQPRNPFTETYGDQSYSFTPAIVGGGIVVISARRVGGQNSNVSTRHGSEIGTTKSSNIVYYPAIAGDGNKIYMAVNTVSGVGAGSEGISFDDLLLILSAGVVLSPVNANDKLKSLYHSFQNPAHIQRDLKSEDISAVLYAIEQSGLLNVGKAGDYATVLDTLARRYGMPFNASSSLTNALNTLLNRLPTDQGQRLDLYQEIINDADNTPFNQFIERIRYDLATCRAPDGVVNFPRVVDLGLLQILKTIYESRGENKFVNLFFERVAGVIDSTPLIDQSQDPFRQIANDGSHGFPPNSHPANWEARERADRSSGGNPLIEMQQKQEIISLIKAFAISDPNLLSLVIDQGSLVNTNIEQLAEFLFYIATGRNVKGVNPENAIQTARAFLDLRHAATRNTANPFPPQLPNVASEQLALPPPFAQGAGVYGGMGYTNPYTSQEYYQARHILPNPDLRESLNRKIEETALQEFRENIEKGQPVSPTIPQVHALNFDCKDEKDEEEIRRFWDRLAILAAFLAQTPTYQGAILEHIKRQIEARRSSGQNPGKYWKLAEAITKRSNTYFLGEAQSNATIQNYQGRIQILNSQQEQAIVMGIEHAILDLGYVVSLPPHEIPTETRKKLVSLINKYIDTALQVINENTKASRRNNAHLSRRDTNMGIMNARRRRTNNNQPPGFLSRCTQKAGCITGGVALVATLAFGGYVVYDRVTQNSPNQSETADQPPPNHIVDLINNMWGSKNDVCNTNPPPSIEEINSGIPQKMAGQEQLSQITLRRDRQYVLVVYGPNNLPYAVSVFDGKGNVINATPGGQMKQAVGLSSAQLGEIIDQAYPHYCGNPRFDRPDPSKVEAWIVSIDIHKSRGDGGVIQFMGNSYRIPYTNKFFEGQNSDGSAIKTVDALIVGFQIQR